MKSAVDKLNERKNLSSIYLLCRALTAVAEVVNTDLLANEFGAKLEEVVYNTIRKCNPFVSLLPLPSSDNFVFRSSRTSDVSTQSAA